MPSEPIAIVGAGALFPGSIGVAGFWQNILEKRDNITDVPDGHWRTADYFDPNPKAEDKTYARRGAFLPTVDFDTLSWGIPPALVPATDTSQLLALIVAKMVLDDVSSKQGRALDLSRTSVILGVTGAQELFGTMVSRLQRPVWERSLREMGLPESQVEEACRRIAAHYVPWQEASFPGLLGNVVAGRIANRLDLRGTNCVIDAACASSLAAVHLAVNELALGQSDMVVTGGVDTLNDILMHMCFSKTPALSPRNDCRPFDVDADGTLLGEGLGMMALKRLADAERDGDAVYAVIRGLGTGSDGRSKSVYAPVSEGQARALAAAYEAAGYGPDTVELVEAHGTATRAGDAAEVEGLKQAFSGRGARPPATPPGRSTETCALGSVKSQIGHTKAAAGAAGLLKVVLALHHKVLPPTIKVTAPNPVLGLEGSPFYLNTEARPWVRGPAHPRRASVSAFGFGGSNFHVACEEYVGPAPRPARMDPPGPELLLYSAERAETLIAAVRATAGADLPRAALASARSFDRRAPLRLALVATADTLSDVLQRAEAAIAEGRPTTRGGVYFQPGVDPRKVAFLFPGQGSQHLEMARGLAMRFDAARVALDVAEGALPGLARVMYPPPRFSDEALRTDEARLVRTEWAQPAIGAASLAALAVLGACGFAPDATAGHSFGELTALHAAGAMEADTLVRAARVRGEAMAAAASEPGAMIAVTAGIEAVQELLPSGVVVANHNAPDQVVLSGEAEAVRALQATLDARGIRAVRLPVSTAFHSPLVAPAGASLARWLRDAPLHAPAPGMAWSNTTALPWPEELPPTALADALGQHLRSPVRFVEQVRAMHAAGVRTFVEVGPGSVLTALVGRILAEVPHVAVATDRKGEDGVAAILGALGLAAALGLPVDVSALWSARLPLPEPLPAAKAPVAINGTNSGKPWPTPATPILPPNPERVAVPTAATAPPMESTVPTPDATLAAALLEAQARAAEAHERFQRAMTESHMAFLRAQEDTTRAILAMMAPGSVAPGSVPPVVASAPPSWSAPAVPAWTAPAPPVMTRTAPPVAVLPPVAVAQPAPVIAPAPPLPVAPPAHVPPAATTAPAQDLATTLLEVVADKTGYPTAMLRLEMNLEADLGIDSIKRVEILSAVRERAPETPEASADVLGRLKTLGDVVAFLGSATPAATIAAPTTSTPAVVAPPTVHAAPQVSALDLGALLLDVVADKTGYPTAMLRLDMSLEADLGIDSIKRVEILSAVRERAPHAPEADADALGRLKTLGQVADFLRGGPSATEAQARLPF